MCWLLPKTQITCGRPGIILSIPAPSLPATARSRHAFEDHDWVHVDLWEAYADAYVPLSEVLAAFARRLAASTWARYASNNADGYAIFHVCGSDTFRPAYAGQNLALGFSTVSPVGLGLGLRMVLVGWRYMSTTLPLNCIPIPIRLWCSTAATVRETFARRWTRRTRWCHRPSARL